MAQWRDVAKAFALGDGHVSQKEVAKLREALLVDGYISKPEYEFLLEIKQEATTSVQMLDELIAECAEIVEKQKQALA